MQHFFMAILLAVCISIVSACGAPPNENSTVKKHSSQDQPSDMEIVAGDPNRVYNVKTRRIGKSLGLAFNDNNDVQTVAAKAIGITPINSIRDAYNLKSPIVKIASGKEYTLDTLTHSIPYLVPKAATLLADIGTAFTDTVKARGGKDCKIIVTSVLRTDNTISSLRKRNRNAIESSCHVYGTTFDISWRRFHHSDSSYIMSTEDLKNILGEVLYRLRQEGRCYVKFERKQSCFHITTR